MTPRTLLSSSTLLTRLGLLAPLEFQPHPEPQQAQSLATPSTHATSTRSCLRLAETLLTSVKMLRFRLVLESMRELLQLHISRFPPLLPPSPSQLSRATLMPRLSLAQLPPLVLTNQLSLWSLWLLSCSLCSESLLSKKDATLQDDYYMMFM